MTYNLEEHIQYIERCALTGQINNGLTAVMNAVLNISLRDAASARVFSSEALDWATMQLGQRGHFKPQPIEGRVAILATALTRSGGHSRIVGEIIKADPGRSFTVLISNVGHQLTADSVSKLFPENVDVLLAPEGSLAARLNWVQTQLKTLRPQRTYLMQHPFDSVMVAAAQPELTGRLIFHHHCDHKLTLGVHIPHALHVDPHAKGLYNCRDSEGLTSNVYWPLCGDKPEGFERFKANAAHRRPGLTTACVGGMEKFETIGMIEPLPYRFDYADVVGRILSTTGGRHVHIGPLSDEMLVRIQDRLQQLGAAAKQFTHLSFAPKLGEALAIHEVDLYLGSMPRGGGKALIEAMAIGMPMLLHDNYRSHFFSDIGEAYPGVLSWRTLNDLGKRLDGMTLEVLAAHGQRARDHYARLHTPKVFRETLRRSLAGRALADPPRAAYRRDALQVFLDERALIDVHGGSAVVSTTVLLEAIQGVSEIVEPAPTPKPLIRLDVLSGDFRPALGADAAMNVELIIYNTDKVEVVGWAVATPRLSHIKVFDSGKEVATVAPDRERPDVLAAYPNYKEVLCGFSVSWQAQNGQPSALEFELYSGAKRVAKATFSFAEPIPN